MIKNKYDPTIQLLYQIAKEKFEDECLVEEEKLTVTQDLCYKGKISIVNRKNHALCFFMHHDEKQREVAPIEDTPKVSSLTATTYYRNSLTVDDNTFVENFIAKMTDMKKKRGGVFLELYIHLDNP